MQPDHNQLMQLIAKMQSRMESQEKAHKGEVQMLQQRLYDQTNKANEEIKSLQNENARLRDINGRLNARLEQSNGREQQQPNHGFSNSMSTNTSHNPPPRTLEEIFGGGADAAAATPSAHPTFGAPVERPDNTSNQTAPTPTPAQQEPPKQLIPEVQERMHRIQQMHGPCDTRAMQSLLVLSSDDSIKVVDHLEKALSNQGTQAKNLSAMLQSMCRKLKAGHDLDEPASQDWNSTPWGNDTATAQDNSYAQTLSKGKGKGKGGKSEPGRPAAPGAVWGQPPQSAPGVAPAVPTVDHSPEEVPMKPAKVYNRPVRREDNAGRRADETNMWTDNYFERLATHKKALILRPPTREVFTKSLICVDMSEGSPPLTDKGMASWCEWFQCKMIEYVSVHGSDSLPQSRADINFANNEISDEGLRSLLEVLLNFQIHVARLQLSGNNLTSAGMIALTDFVQQNTKPHPIWELHLAFNRVEDHAIKQFVDVIDGDKRYPPVTRQKSGLVATPFVFRVNNNCIGDPDGFLGELASRGICEKIRFDDFDKQDPVSDPSLSESAAWKTAGQRGGKSYAAALGPKPTKVRCFSLFELFEFFA